MALPPQTEKLRKEIFHKCEKVIDQAIREAADPHLITVDVSLFPRNYHYCQDQICEKYRSVGWKSAGFVDDQRGGEFFQLTA